MGLTASGLPHCRRCQVELEGGEQVCPRCNFDPKQIGLRIAGFAFLAVILSMIAAQITVFFYPTGGLVFMLLAGGAFVLSIITFLAAMLATPYRFGNLFKRF